MIDEGNNILYDESARKTQDIVSLFYVKHKL